MNRLDNNKKGILTIEIYSLSPEKFVNLLWKNGINVKNVCKKDVSTISMEIQLKDYHNIQKLAKRSRVKIKVVDRRGIFFIKTKYKHRKAFVIGCVLFVCMVYYLATFIWSIHIETESTLSPYEIRQQLKGYGIKPGINKKDINVFEIEEKLLTGNDEVVWVRARIDGTKLKIKIAERQAPPNLVHDDTPCDLVAVKDGEISRVYTKAGTPVVAEGDIVKKGEVVVKGMQGNEENSYYVHAEGNVIARTFYERKKTVELNSVERKRTGKIIKNMYIEIKGKKIYLKNRLNKFENYDKIVDNSSFIKSEILYEVNEKKKAIEDVDNAVENTINELYSDVIINFDKSVKIIDEIEDIRKNEESYTVRLVVIVEENIAVPRKIEDIEENKSQE